SRESVQRPTRSIDTQQLVIVRRGQFATFGLLVKALTEEPNVRIIWDRRVQERRQQSASNRSRDRRGPDRRDASLLWAHHDYIVIRTRALDPAAGVASLALSRERTLTAVVRQAARELDQDLEIAT